MLMAEMLTHQAHELMGVEYAPRPRASGVVGVVAGNFFRQFNARTVD